MIQSRFLGQMLALMAGPVMVLAQDAARPVPLPRATTLLTASGETNRLRIFISNPGSDADSVIGHGTSITGGPGQAYNKFYAVVQSTRQYQLVGSPAEADLVFEIRYFNSGEPARMWQDKPDPNHTRDPNLPPEQESVEYTVYHPQVHLAIFDPRTHGVQAAFTQHIEIARTQPERDDRLSFATSRLVEQANTYLGRAHFSADVPGYVSYAPQPSQIASARTVFIANTMPSVTAYNRFYALMKKWGGYQLLPQPAGADLILQLSGNQWQVTVEIIDPQTGVTLWGFPHDLGISILKRNVQKSVDKSLVAIAGDIATLSGRSGTANSNAQGAESAALSPPQISIAKTVFISNAGIEPLSDWDHKLLQPYDAFYATMQSWARFKLMPTPAEADLVFQISIDSREPLVLRLQILDPKSRAPLCMLDQKIHGDHGSFGTFAERKNLDKAAAALVASVAKLAGQPNARITVAPYTQTAPVPSAIVNFKKAFISKPRSEADFFAEYAQGRLFAELTSDLQNLGRYQLTSPKDADLIIEPSGWNGRIRLTVRDAQTGHILWTFIRLVKTGLFTGNAVKNYQTAIGLLVADLGHMAPSPQSTNTSAESR